jgi:putative membrane protein
MGDGLLILSYAVAGVALGTVTGLVPGLHVNSVAFLLVGIAPTLSGPAVAVGAAVISAGIVHTFLSVIPGLVLGVPEAATAAGALPGHRLVLQGYGREAIRLSALGSGISLTAALIGAVPLSWIIAS